MKDQMFHDKSFSFDNTGKTAKLLYLKTFYVYSNVLWNYILWQKVMVDERLERLQEQKSLLKVTV